jgi:ribosomal protein L29
MTKKKNSHIEGKSIAELLKEEVQARKEIAKSRVEMTARRLKNSNAVKNLKIKLARILTAKRILELAHK